MSVSPALPWLFPYVEEPVNRAYPPGTGIILRPVLEITVVGSDDEVKVAALVDSGSESVLGGPWIPRAIGVTPDPATEIKIGIGARREVFGSRMSASGWSRPPRYDRRAD